MIRKNLLLCKIFRIKTSSKSLFDSYMAKFQPHLETCPLCGSTGNCHIHDYYDRSLVDFHSGIRTRYSLCVMRVFCDSSAHAHAIRKPVHEALRQRITVHYNYAGLSDDEVSKYILHKLQLAGASSAIIDPAELAAAHSFTQGNPRLIDNLMTDALTIGSQQDRKVIDAETIRAAVDNQGLY